MENTIALIAAANDKSSDVNAEARIGKVNTTEAKDLMERAIVAAETLGERAWFNADEVICIETESQIRADYGDEADDYIESLEEYAYEIGVDTDEAISAMVMWFDAGEE